MSAEGIQQVALVSGMCTAGGAYQPTMSDIAIITHRYPEQPVSHGLTSLSQDW